MDAADVILSKGQGNVETLYGCGYPIFYAFLVKCPAIPGPVRKGKADAHVPGGNGQTGIKPNISTRQGAVPARVIAFAGKPPGEANRIRPAGSRVFSLLRQG